MSVTTPLRVNAEPEITAPVDECTPDGRLNPAAVGWSRQPLHRCNLRGHWPRKKRWDYWCVTTDRYLVQFTYADLDYLGLAVVGFLDFDSRRSIEKAVAVPFAAGFFLPETVGGASITFSGMGLRMGLLEERGGTRLEAEFHRGSDVAVDVFVERLPGHETLNVVIPWSDDRFQFTSKQNCRPAHGIARIDGKELPFGPQNHAFGCLDYGRWVWPYHCVWNWASGSGVQNGRTVGVTLGGRWTDGTGMTENGVVVDGRLHKIGEDLLFEYDRGNWMKPWRITAPQTGRVDLTLTPFHLKRARIDLLLLSSELHVMFGRFSGRVVTDGGETIAIRDLIGWSEEHRARW